LLSQICPQLGVVLLVAPQQEGGDAGAEVAGGEAVGPTETVDIMVLEQVIAPITHTVQDRETSLIISTLAT